MLPALNRMHIHKLYVVLSPSLAAEVGDQDIFFEYDVAERIATNRNNHRNDSGASDWKVVTMVAQDYWLGYAP